MSDQRHNDPLHGVTLKAILSDLLEHYDWEQLGERVRINCFLENPSVNSSLKFLRKTPWARAKVEDLYLETHGHPLPVRKPLPPAPADRKGKHDAKYVKPRINPWTGEPYENE